MDASEIFPPEICTQEDPLKNQKPDVDISKTSKPVAGEEMDSRWIVDILGISIPRVVLWISTAALAFGEVVPMPTDCDQIPGLSRARHTKIIAVLIRNFFMVRLGFVCH